MRQRLLLALVVMLIAGSGSARAATFHILYDGSPNQVLATALVGQGTFSYDGAPVAGSFALSSLSGMAFDAVVRGETFTTADLATDSSASGIFVYSIASRRLCIH